MRINKLYIVLFIIYIATLGIIPTHVHHADNAQNSIIIYSSHQAKTHNSSHYPQQNNCFGETAIDHIYENGVLLSTNYNTNTNIDTTIIHTYTCISCQNKFQAFPNKEPAFSHQFECFDITARPPPANPFC